MSALHILPAGRSSASRPPLQGAVLCDYREENWPSMELVAGALMSNSTARGTAVRLTRIQPKLRQRLGRFKFSGFAAAAHNVDRLIGRMWDYPRLLRHSRRQFDFFHVSDHSYSQLIHELPAERTGVYCHDLDTFRCLLEPDRDRRSRPFRGMAARILSGFRKASIVFHSTSVVRREILAHGLVEPERLVLARPGVCAEYFQANLMQTTQSLTAGRPYLLHVGSTIPRKRIDVLLRTFARLGEVFPDLILVKVGGCWTVGQSELLSCLGIEDRILHLRDHQSVPMLAALYRDAELVLMPSSSEGFGLPVAEALAAGACVVCSDIEVFREVGGDAALYCAEGDVEAWVRTVSDLLQARTARPDPGLSAAWASQFSWPSYANTILQAYEGLAR